MSTDDRLEAVDGSVDDTARADATHAETPGVPTPDQARHDGMRPELAPLLSHAETSGDVENRARKGNLEGM